MAVAAVIVTSIFVVTGLAVGAVQWRQRSDASYAAPADSEILVDLRTAQRVFENLWPNRVRAVNGQDFETLRAIEAGAARDFDQVACEDPCDYIQPEAARVEFTAPRQSVYPASFLAQVLIECVCFEEGVPSRARLTNFVVFRCDDPSVPWKIALITAVAGESNALRSTDESSLLRGPPSVVGLGATDLPATLAEYLNTVKRTGKPPAASTLLDTGVLRERVTGMVEAAARWKEQGIRDVVTYRSGAAEDGTYDFSTSSDRLFRCSTVRWDGTFTPTSSKGIVVAPDDRPFYGSMIGVGTYRSIAHRGVRQSCFFVNPTASGVEVVGIMGGYVAVKAETA